MVRVVLLAFILFYSSLLFSQSFPNGFDYQAVYRDATGNPISNSNIEVKVGLYSIESDNILIWEEISSAITNNDGYYQLIIGEGDPTGMGLVNDFNAINWSFGNYSLKISIDAGSGYEDFTMDKIYSVPFAYYAKQAENQLYLNNMMDVDTSNLNSGDILRWSGQEWQAFPYSDTVMWAYNALNSYNSNFSDTSIYAYNALTCPPCDSAIFTYYGDSALWSEFTNSSNFSYNAIYSDTALVALESLNSWSLNGNSNLDSASFLGTTDSTDLSMITNNQERIIVKADGKIGIGINEPKADLHINGNDGVLFTGDFGSETNFEPDTGSAMFWIPSKSAFRAGYVNNNAWDMGLIGNYSFASGFNCTASGKYSFSIGEESLATGESAVAMSWKAKAFGKRSIAMGPEAKASSYGAIAIGRTAIASDSLGIAIGGKGARAYAKGSVALGYNSKAFADYSVVIGQGAISNHEGAIVISTSGATSTADNQLLIGARGGTVIYSDAAMTTGVTLAAGSGSWSTLSDSTLKENIETPDIEEIVNEVKELEVYTWNYKAQNDSIRHIGPMAQDFYAAFGLGENEKTISSVDIDGINFLLLKDLLEKDEILKSKVKELKELNEQLVILNRQNKLILELISKDEKLSFK